MNQKIVFHENWYPESQLGALTKVFKLIKGFTGANVEIGCWEGKSTIALANECYPEILTAVDSWNGNLAEGEDHESVKIARVRDVFSLFLQNIQNNTNGNVKPVRDDCFHFLEEFHEPIKFCHIDASHDYQSVFKTIKLLLPKLTKVAILCGDDFLSSNIRRTDLEGGVERAVTELLNGFQHFDNFWFWVNINEQSNHQLIVP